MATIPLGEAKPDSIATRESEHLAKVFLHEFFSSVPSLGPVVTCKAAAHCLRSSKVKLTGAYIYIYISVCVSTSVPKRPPPSHLHTSDFKNTHGGTGGP